MNEYKVLYILQCGNIIYILKLVISLDSYNPLKIALAPPNLVSGTVISCVDNK